MSHGIVEQTRHAGAKRQHCPGKSRVAGFVQALLLPLAVLLSMVWPAGLKAEGAGERGRTDARLSARAFDIPRQALQDALEQYSIQSGSSVLYLGTLVRGRVSSAVSGRYTNDAALRLMLRDTGLEATYTDQNSLVLRERQQADSAAAPAAPQGQAAYAQYYGLVQAGLQRSLCQEPTIAAEDFRAALQFWVSDTGRVERVNLLDTTGDAARDEALLAAVGKAVLAAPPAGFAQPLTMIMLPQAAGRTASCNVGR